MALFCTNPLPYPRPVMRIMKISLLKLALFGALGSHEFRASNFGFRVFRGPAPGQLALFVQGVKCRSKSVKRQITTSEHRPYPAEPYTLSKEPRRSNHAAKYLHFQIVSLLQSYHGPRPNQEKCPFLAPKSVFKILGYGLSHQ